nr:venom protein U-MPTX.14-Mc28 [Megalopyge crispata]
MQWTTRYVLVVSLLYSVSNEVIELDRRGFRQVNENRDDFLYNINEFGHNLLLRMKKENPGKNIVISPASISGLMAMTMLGTVGATYEELSKTLGFSEDILSNHGNHQRFGNLLQLLNSNDTSSRTTFADAIFASVDTKLRDLYRIYLSAVYKGDAFNANFSDSASAKEQINEWVRNQTNCKIKEFLTQPLPEQTKVVLLSALYFSGQWAHPFIPEYTKKMTFTKDNGEEIVANLMLNAGLFDYMYSITEGLHMVALPYNDSITTMYVLKPFGPSTLTLSELMDNLDYRKIDDLINRMSKRRTIIRFPKMELESRCSLENSLKAVGVKSIFSPGVANFALMIDNDKAVNTSEEIILSRINIGTEQSGWKDLLNKLPNPGIYVDSVIHNVKMSINEYGTEAAAASAGVLARTAELFYADTPFYAFIRNEKTKLITFSAVIFDPSTV